MRCLGCLVRRVVSSSSFLSKAHPRRFNSLAALAVAALVCLGAASARAQSAQFSYAQSTIGSALDLPEGVAVDSSGNVYIIEAGNDRVLKVPPTDSTCAANDCTVVGGSGLIGPQGVAVDASGNVYIAETGQNHVLKVPPTDLTCATAGDCTILGGLGLNAPIGVAVDASGNVYIADSDNDRVLKVPPTDLNCTTAGDCTNIGGSGLVGPAGVAVDASGNVYIADINQNRVLKVPPTDPTCATAGDCTTIGSGLNQPFAMAVDESGNIYIADTLNNRVLKVPPTDPTCVTAGDCTVIGSGLNRPFGVAVGGSGSVYIADFLNNRVLKVQTSGVNFGSAAVNTSTPATQTLTFTFTGAGQLSSATPYQAVTQGAANLDFNAAATQEPGVCSGASSYAVGQTCTVDVTFTPTKAGTRYGAVNLLSSTGAVIATAYVYGTGSGPQVAFSPATQSAIGSNLNGAGGMAVDGGGNVYIVNSDSSPAQVLKETLSGGVYTQSVMVSGLSYPSGVAVDGGGNVYITESGQVLKETLSGGVYTQSTIGSGLSYPSGVAVDGGGNVYIVDEARNQVLKETLFGGVYTQSVMVSGLSYPQGVAVDGSGNVFITDSNNNRVLKETPSAGGYTQSTVGSGLSTPYGVAVDGSGNVYVAEPSEDLVLKETLQSDGSYAQGTILSGLFQPFGVAVDGSGILYVTYVSTTALKADYADAPSLNFASTAVGSTSSDSPRTVTVENIGNLPLTFPIPTVAGSYNPSVPANFSYSDSSTCLQNGASAATAFTLASGASCTMAIDFAPVAPGAIGGDAVLTDDSLNAAAPGYATQSISLSGTATQSPLTITANDASRVYGAANPAFMGSVTGQQNGDTFTESFTTPATLSSGPGAYAIVPSVTGSNLSAYAVTAVNGTLTVTQAASATALSASASSVAPGQSLTLTATVTDSSAGSTGTPTGTVSFFDGSTLLGTATLSGGTATYTTSTLATGVTHSLTASYAGDTNFLASTSSSAVSVPVVALDFSLNLSGAQNQTVVPGGSATYSFQLAPVSGSYPGAVSFSVSGLPAGATATFTPSTIAANGGAQTVTMTIQTRKPGTSARNSNPFERGSGTLLLGFLLFPLLGIRRVRKALRGRGAVMLLLLIAGLAGTASITGCGTRNGFNGQAAQDYTVTVTATSGGTQHSLGVNLNVQ